MRFLKKKQLNIYYAYKYCTYYILHYTFKKIILQNAMFFYELSLENKDFITFDNKVKTYDEFTIIKKENKHTCFYCMLMQSYYTSSIYF